MKELTEITPAFHVKKIIAVTMVTELSIDIAMYDLRTEVLP